MKKNKIIPFIIVFSAIAFIELFGGCTKIQHGYLSPFIAYQATEFTVVAGRTTFSTTLNLDGSTTPIHAKWLHFYDSTGKNVDAIFSKKNLVDIWTAAFDPKSDLSFDQISAKLQKDTLEPLSVSEESGVITSNAGSLNLPLGTYTMDLQVSNPEGTEVLKNILKINIVHGNPMETDPQVGTFAVGWALANQAQVNYFYNGPNIPYLKYTINRISDQPNLLIVKVMDKNGVPFNPKSGEIKGRPNTGLNPNPPYLQNLEAYAPDTYETTDTSMSVKFPLAPFPTASLGNGYHMYYNISASAVIVDSTSKWSGNSAGNYYQGVSDPHYLGVFTPGVVDYSVRFPLRIYVPGTYEYTVKLLNATHR
ncbi:hypothetical protein FW778_16880 [Ginsengibacter hankyongi]|uniref:DUF5007 domain-containing protein n=1 Tax=Ginsengibacter hankyongi TaxID=2607284 RepID=A0A5J5IEP9_9BACT|nr:hypothetical protein [Ginsengibacter hankyongi]KAA9037763.1 hypothetical protein FW778_16880 [Ginsengibacter hankyongi]